MKPEPVTAELRGRVFQILADFAPDSESAMHMPEIARRAKIAEREGSAYRTRAAIKALIETDGKPIGTNDKGAWLISNDEDMYRALAGIESRMHSLRERRNALVRAYEKWKKESKKGRRLICSIPAEEFIGEE